LPAVCFGAVPCDAGSVTVAGFGAAEVSAGGAADPDVPCVSPAADGVGDACGSAGGAAAPEFGADCVVSADGDAGAGGSSFTQVLVFESHIS
jgi:hypothetical protein